MNRQDSMRRRAGKNAFGGRRRRKQPGIRGFLLIPGLLFLAVLVWLSQTQRMKKHDDGEYLTLQEARNLVCLLMDTAGRTEDEREEYRELWEDGEETFLTYGVWQQINRLFEEYGFRLPDGYAGKDRVLLADWYDYFDRIKAVLDPDGRIRCIRLIPVGIGEDVTDPDGRTMEENRLLAVSENGEEMCAAFLTDRLQDCLYRPVTVVEREGILYAVRSVDGQESRLSNVWILEDREEELLCFWGGYTFSVRFPDGEPIRTGNEKVAVLSFRGGKPDQIRVREEKISGKLLRLTEEGAEIEGHGFLPFSDDCRVYDLRGRICSPGRMELQIGYAFADYVVEDGKIQAALVVRDESMESIRVLIRTSGYEGLYHERVELSADCDLTVGSSGDKENAFVLPAGESLSIDRDSAWLDGGRIYIVPVLLTGRIRLGNVERNRGSAKLRGSLELDLRPEGILVINELMLEEYLCSVLPGEMPASYPQEALKAQAVCARTYAYARMLQAGLPQLGAHVDDSSSFQVYGNADEQAQTTRAVRETGGMLLYYADKPAQTFYYSTSCGYGTDPGIWKNTDPESLPYLCARAVRFEETQQLQETDGIHGTDCKPFEPEEMRREEVFAAFIREGRDTDLEREEPWYRWSAELTLDENSLYARAKNRYAADPGSFYVMQADGSFGQQEPGELGKIRDICIASRNSGGAVRQLIVEGERETWMVETEYNIRYLLCDGSTKIVRQDGSEYTAAGLLPSGFFVLAVVRRDGYVIGYTLTGGGFGHGVGMSQNAARSMAQRGQSCRDILAFFYPGCRLTEIEKESRNTADGEDA